MKQITPGSKVKIHGEEYVYLRREWSQSGCMHTCHGHLVAGPTFGNYDPNIIQAAAVRSDSLMQMCFIPVEHEDIIEEIPVESKPDEDTKVLGGHT
jgi:hypothetical protein